MLRQSQVEVRLRLKVADFAGARLLADSTLRGYANLEPRTALDLAPLAGLVGDREGLLRLLEAGATAQTFQSAEGERLQPPAMLAVPAMRLLGYSILGGPVDSVRSLENRINGLSRVAPDRNTRRTFRRALLAAPAELGFPIYGARSLHTDPGADYLLSLQEQFSKGEFAKLRSSFIELERLRRSPPEVAPGQIGLDALYQESWMRAGMGDSSGAVRELDAGLGALSVQNTPAFQTVQGPASLVLAMALRAQLAARQDDIATARRWANAVVALWDGASLPIDISAMKRIAATGRENP